MLQAFLHIEFSAGKTAITLAAVTLLAFLDLSARAKRRTTTNLFSCFFGTLLSAGFIGFTRVLFSPGVQGNQYVLALGLLLLLTGWRLLFGPWDGETKATVLGTFLFWVMLHLLWKESPDDRVAHLIAIGVAAVPAAIWCSLFLSYHKERWSLVLLMFFAGMISTAPILFYDALVRSGSELNFFLFRIVPESFSQSTELFVQEHFPAVSTVHRSLLSVFTSFLVVGLIEETSKLWVLKRSGQRLFSSIDDVMQLAIMVAIGFAFAENIANQGYFLSFVREYLVQPQSPDWSSFFGNVLGRSVLTTMVHVVSTGILGYFLGKAVFATPILGEGTGTSRRHRVSAFLGRVLRIQPKPLFRIQMMLQGILIAIFLHALSNFLVTVPDILPGNPRTLGDLLGKPEESLLHYISILLFPALLYVVGGFWLLTELFARKENIVRHGRIISTDTFVLGEERP